MICDLFHVFILCLNAHLCSTLDILLYCLLLLLFNAYYHANHLVSALLLPLLITVEYYNYYYYYYYYCYYRSVCSSNLVSNSSSSSSSSSSISNSLYRCDICSIPVPPLPLPTLFDFIQAPVGSHSLNLPYPATHLSRALPVTRHYIPPCAPCFILWLYLILLWWWIPLSYVVLSLRWCSTCHNDLLCLCTHVRMTLTMITLHSNDLWFVSCFCCMPWCPPMLYNR